MKQIPDRYMCAVLCSVLGYMLCGYVIHEYIYVVEYPSAALGIAFEYIGLSVLNTLLLVAYLLLTEKISRRFKHWLFWVGFLPMLSAYVPMAYFFSPELRYLFSDLLDLLY